MTVRKLVREKTGMTQKQFAEYFGIPFGRYRTGYSDRKNAGTTGLNLCSINSKKKDLLTLTKMNVTKFVTFERKGLLI